ncbi:MAG: phytanoyl-CoA dioxygenase family protein [Gammaproteobacteria bacterium]|nr:phytanoyl-CoA dioxygenase family protein [Gammaproteobacteria bacterium]
MKLTAQDIQDFRHHGYCVSRGFFDAGEVQEMSGYLDRLRTGTPAEGTEACYYENSPLTGESLLVRAEHILGEHNPGMTSLMLAPKVMDALAALLGEPAILFKEKVNYKLPGCRADKLHQDQAAGWGSYADFFVTMAIVVDPNRRDNAALSFLANGKYERALMGPEWQPLTEADPPYEPAEDYQLLEANPGDVIFFDCYVPHGSPPNSSDRQRRNIYLTFNRQSAGDLRQRYYHDKWAVYPPNRPGEARATASYRV